MSNYVKTFSAYPILTELSVERIDNISELRVFISLLPQLTNLDNLVLPSGINDDEFETLSTLTKLTCLAMLCGHHLTDRSIVSLSKLPDLRILSLEGSRESNLTITPSRCDLLVKACASTTVQITPMKPTMSSLPWLTR